MFNATNTTSYTPHPPMGASVPLPGASSSHGISHFDLQANGREIEYATRNIIRKVRRLEAIRILIFWIHVCGHGAPQPARDRPNVKQLIKIQQMLFSNNSVAFFNALDQIFDNSARWNSKVKNRLADKITGYFNELAGKVAHGVHTENQEGEEWEKTDEWFQENLSEGEQRRLWAALGLEERGNYIGWKNINERVVKCLYEQAKKEVERTLRKTEKKRFQLQILPLL